jgi:hypothetical protein
MSDGMIGEHCYFWSYDIATAKWSNEAMALNEGNASNMPAARSELPVT